MPLQVTTPVAIPFGFNTLPDCAGLNAELRSLFLQRERDGRTYANVQPTMQINPALFESRFDLFKWPDAPVRRLREFCWENLYAMVGQTTTHDPTTVRKLVGHADAWFHITRRGGWFGLHNHPMASWSGVYCVDAGRDDGTRRDSGLLSFPHPARDGAMFVDPASRALKLPYNYMTREFRLEAGQLVLFPSWLMHQVTPFSGEGERITVAFNAWFTMP